MNEADPYVMEMQINAAADHGVQAKYLNNIIEQDHRFIKEKDESDAWF